MKVTAETLTDEQCRSAYKAGIVTELMYVTAIGASGAERENDDGDTEDPTDNEVEDAREFIAAAINARTKETP